MGSNNATNVVWATLDGLRQLETIETVGKRRGLDVTDIL
ncbi:MAG TPA: hypothetical protein PKY01_04370 [Candidatus Hydrogenedentes bacterium]|nr:hypothetical protein [Candidatus Hydrogenedentota bacterium]